MIDITTMPVTEALAMARQGEIEDGQSALARCLCGSLLRAYGADAQA